MFPWLLSACLVMGQDAPRPGAPSPTQGPATPEKIAAPGGPPPDARYVTNPDTWIGDLPGSHPIRLENCSEATGTNPDPAAPQSVTAVLPVPGYVPPDQAPKPAPPPPPKEEKRRAMPSPWASPPIPGSEYQGYPLVGVPVDNTRWPLQKALQGTPVNDFLDWARIRAYG
jgi:hypothetical protein